MRESYIAGLMIGIAAYVFCALGGGPFAACLFSVGLMGILVHEMALFTGKAGLLATGDIDWKDLLRIWCGNFLGVFSIVVLTCCFECEAALNYAAAIVTKRSDCVLFENLARGIGCGILMYCAVEGSKRAKNDTMGALLVITCVAAFILGGFNHCVADMYYTFAGMDISSPWRPVAALLLTTGGNLIGCNIIPVVRRYLV